MKRIWGISAAVLLWAGAAMAGQFKATELTVDIDTNGAGSVTASNVWGYVDEILIDVPGDGQTGTVSVVANRTIGTMAALSLATNVVAGDYVVRPVVDSTDGTGGDLASDPPRRPLLYGETVTFSVSAANTTNVQWRCIIKQER